jgi:chorismate mutase
MKTQTLKQCRLLGSLLIAAIGASALTATYAATVEAKDFSRLVELSFTRLDISRKVALTKWDTKMPIADPPNDPREKQVIDAASEEAKNSGLSTDLASAFFADQIEASKLVQFVLFADWTRSAKVPTEARGDLKSELRPALDRLRTQFIEELIATRKLRKEADCRLQLAKSSASYAKRRQLTPLFSIALDRGLARACDE